MEEAREPWQGPAMAVLSIQSHVAFGAIGNRAAVLVLERLGIETWSVPTVLYSNHPGHATFRGERVAVPAIRAMIEGLGEVVPWQSCQAVLSGYAADSGVVDLVVDAVHRVRHANPQGFLACNAAFANEDGVFVPEPVARATCHALFREAGLLFLNQAELEFATGRVVAGVTAARNVARELWQQTTKAIVVTSVRSEDGATATIALERDATWVVETPRLPGPAHGAGDLFSALFLAHWLKRRSPAEALAKSVAGTFGVIAASGEALDLALVSAQEEIVAPSRVFAVRPLA